MFVHSGYIHISSNIIVQLLLGLPLEIVHGPWRIGLVYLAGVLTGALATTLTDPNEFLAGASGGVYALMLAHLPTLIMNWQEMKTFFEWLVSIVILSMGLVDFGVAIYHRYHEEPGHGSIGYAAHIGGGTAGLLVGMNVLRNFHHKVILKKLFHLDLYLQKWEGYLRLICFLIWTIGIVISIVANSVAKQHFPKPNRNSIGECSYYE